MASLLLFSVLSFRGPLTFFLLVGDIGERGGIKMASASTPSVNELKKGLILVHTVKLKQITKAQISGKLVTSGISDVAVASVHSEKTRMKKMNMIIISMNKSQELTVFDGCQ